MRHKHYNPDPFQWAKIPATSGLLNNYHECGQPKEFLCPDWLSFMLGDEKQMEYGESKFKWVVIKTFLLVLCYVGCHKWNCMQRCALILVQIQLICKFLVYIRNIMLLSLNNCKNLFHMEVIEIILQSQM